MHKVNRMKSFLSTMAMGLMILPMAAGYSAASADSKAGAGLSPTDPNVDSSSAIVQLKGEPVTTYARTSPVPGKKIDWNNQNVRSYRAQLSAMRNDFKQWLHDNAPRARVTGEFDTAINAVAVELNGESLSSLATAPMVVTAEYEQLYHPLIDDPDLSLIHAVEAWSQAGGPANAGAGVKVAIVDTGIDITHPCFSDAGYPAQRQLGDRRFTNNKVIAAKFFIRGNNDYSPEAIQDHGTHVAGTVACNYNTPATVNGVAIPYGISGVAPRALLGNYNVFPAEEENARSEDIMNALEEAYRDGFDVANMSLGGGSNGAQDLLTHVVNNLDRGGMVVAIAAGNSGPGHYTVESPGMTETALTAGASTVGHFVGAPITVAGTVYQGAVGDFRVVTTTLSAPLAVVTGTTNGLSTACSALPAGSLSGKIALISRGACTFSTKIRNAQNAGALAVLVANNVAGDPTAMGSDGSPNQPTIYAYSVSRAAGQALKNLNGQTATIGGQLQYFLTGNSNIMAGFSSQGPTDVNFRVKPDVVAPGVNVLSSVPHTACASPPCFAFFSGTSMATPHLAGSAAVVMGQHPSWSAPQVRSAIVNTANRNVLKDYRTGTQIVTDPNIIGAGLENLYNAVNAKVALNPVSLAFGAVPNGSGQGRSLQVTLTNITGSTQTYTLAVTAGDSSVSYAVNTSSVTLAAGESRTVTVDAQTSRGGEEGDHSAWLTISVGGTEVAHAALYTFLR